MRCVVCGKDFDVKESVRVFGSVPSDSGCCTAQCYTARRCTIPAFDNLAKVLLQFESEGHDATQMLEFEALVRLAKAELEEARLNGARLGTLANALRTLVFAVEPAGSEAFPGHHAAYMQSVALPRAREALKLVAPTERLGCFGKEYTPRGGTPQGELCLTCSEAVRRDCRTQFLVS